MDVRRRSMFQNSIHIYQNFRAYSCISRANFLRLFTLTSKVSRSRRQLVIVCTVVLQLALSALPTAADDFTWQIASSTLFRFSGAWSPSGGPPDANDRAIFSQDFNFPISVAFDVPQTTTAALRVTGGAYNFDSASGGQPGPPRVYTVQGAEASYVDGGTLRLRSGTTNSFTLDIDALFDVGLSNSGTLDISPHPTALTAELRTRRADGIGARIGEQVGSVGAVTVNGANALWNNTGLLIIGNNGTGTLDVLGGGQINVTNGTTFGGRVTVGGNGTGSGELHVDGAGSVLSSSQELWVGDSGTGEVAVSGGGTVVSGGARVGRLPGSTGSIAVSGSDSAWTLNSAFFVGNQGAGQLTIEDGGVVNSTAPDGLGARIGEQSGSVGEVTISGANARWNNTGLLIIGNAGNGTLDVLGGGQVEVTNGTTFGGQVTVGGTGSGVLRVDGVGSALTSTSDLRVGTSGIGQLMISSGSLVDIAGTTTLGLNAGSNGSLFLDGGTLRTGTIATGGGQHGFYWTSGTVEVTGAAGLTIGQSQFFGEQLLLNQNQNLSVTNTLTVESGAILFTGGELVVGELANNGDLALASTTVSGPVTNAAGANITALGNVTFNDLVSGPGGFFGPGTINFNGGMAPGASPAEVTFEGDVSLTDTNTLYIEIGGTTLGDDYDSLTIAGDAVLDGVIDASLIDAFMPAPGQQFTILTANSVVNNGLMLGGSAAGSFNLLVDSTSVILQAIAPPLPGDFDLDGDVDGRDFLVWQRNPAVGDLSDWQANYGAEMLSANIAVPEPSAILLILMAAVAFYPQRR
jgi:T5SS/PEP-CTERM-associated repeat protein